MCGESCSNNTAIFPVQDGWLTQEELIVVSQLDPEFDVMVNTVPHFKKLISPLSQVLVWTTKIKENLTPIEC